MYLKYRLSPNLTVTWIGSGSPRMLTRKTETRLAKRSQPRPSPPRKPPGHPRRSGSGRGRRFPRKRERLAVVRGVCVSLAPLGGRCTSFVSVEGWTTRKPRLGSLHWPKSKWNDSRGGFEDSVVARTTRGRRARRADRPHSSGSDRVYGEHAGGALDFGFMSLKTLPSSVSIESSEAEVMPLP